jgi:hypothetical protein
MEKYSFIKKTYQVTKQAPVETIFFVPRLDSNINYWGSSLMDRNYFQKEKIQHTLNKIQECTTTNIYFTPTFTDQIPEKKGLYHIMKNGEEDPSPIIVRGVNIPHFKVKVIKNYIADRENGVIETGFQSDKYNEPLTHGQYSFLKSQFGDLHTYATSEVLEILKKEMLRQFIESALSSYQEIEKTLGEFKSELGRLTELGFKYCK